MLSTSRRGRAERERHCALRSRARRIRYSAPHLAAERAMAVVDAPRGLLTPFRARGTRKREGNETPNKARGKRNKHPKRPEHRNQARGKPTPQHPNPKASSVEEQKQGPRSAEDVLHTRVHVRSRPGFQPNEGTQRRHPRPMLLREVGAPLSLCVCVCVCVHACVASQAAPSAKCAIH